jgi:hypothetical protein
VRWDGAPSPLFRLHADTKKTNTKKQTNKLKGQFLVAQLWMTENDDKVNTTPNELYLHSGGWRLFDVPSINLANDATRVAAI